MLDKAARGIRKSLRELEACEECSRDSPQPAGSKARRSPLLLRRAALLAGGGAALVATVVFVTWMGYVASIDAHDCTLRAAVCMHQLFQERGIDYWIMAGSLLGSVRHGGFIPWDHLIDIDIGTLAADSDAIKGLKGEFRRRCGMDLIHRDDVAWLPDVSAFVIRRAAFRLFCAPWAPYYLDINDFEQPAPGLDGVQRLVDLHFADESVPHPVADVLPTTPCRFESATLRCPARSEDYLVRTFGPDWRTPVIE